MGYPKSILLVDDDRATNFIHQRVLKEAGFRGHLTVCNSAECALDYLKRDGDFAGGDYPHPDLILLDINMPGLDGWDFIDEYKKLSKTHKNGIIIMMLTTSLNPDDRERASNEEMITRFMSKPINPEIFNQVMSNYFK